MRDTKEIEQDIRNKIIKPEDLIIELLLDIRNLISKQNE